VRERRVEAWRAMELNDDWCCLGDVYDRRLVRRAE
jgi:hypothetical protein